MKVYTVSWGSQDPSGDSAQISHAAEMDQLLNRVDGLRSVDGLPFLVTIMDNDTVGQPFPCALQVGVGHADRARLLYMGPPAGGVGYDPSLPDWPGGEISWDFGGVPTEDDTATTRVTPSQARQAAHEYVATGARPTNVRWDTGANNE